jgi:hypothetical protein
MDIEEKMLRIPWYRQAFVVLAATAAVVAGVAAPASATTTSGNKVYANIGAANAGTDACLDALGTSVEPYGTKSQCFSHSVPGSYWTWHDTNGIYTFTNAGGCLALDSSGYAHLWACDGTSSQQFHVTYNASNSDQFTLKSVMNGKCLGQGSGTGKIFTNPCSTNIWQQWLSHS